MSQKEKRTKLTQVRWTPEERALLDAAVATQVMAGKRTISWLTRSATLTRAREVIAEAKAKSRRRRQARARARIHGAGKGGRK